MWIVESYFKYQIKATEILTSMIKKFFRALKRNSQLIFKKTCISYNFIQVRMKVGIQAKKPLPECGIGLMKVVLDSFEVNNNGFMVSIYSKKFFTKN